MANGDEYRLEPVLQEYRAVGREFFPFPSRLPPPPLPSPSFVPSRIGSTRAPAATVRTRFLRGDDEAGDVGVHPAGSGLREQGSVDPGHPRGYRGGAAEFGARWVSGVSGRGVVAGIWGWGWGGWWGRWREKDCEGVVKYF